MPFFCFIFSCDSCMESLRIISDCPSASWPSSIVPATPIPSWYTLCGRRSWRKVNEMEKKESQQHTDDSFFLSTRRRANHSPCSFWLSELSDSVAMSPADRMQALSLKLVSLGRLYAGTPRYFPLGIITFSANRTSRRSASMSNCLIVSLDVSFECASRFPESFCF